MQKLNFAEAKTHLEEILKLVEVCPDPLKETCFKMLFELAFSGDGQQTPPRRNAPEPQPEELRSKTMAADTAPPPVSDFRLPSNMLAFTRRYEIPLETLQKLFILDHEPLLPIYKITSKVNRTAQLQKVMMILLENGLLNNSLRAPYAELRDTVSESGLMDSNFNKALKANADLFKGAVTKDKITDTETLELTGAGYQRLAEMIKELANPA